jgi:hypothetical protein
LHVASFDVLPLDTFGCGFFTLFFGNGRGAAMPGSTSGGGFFTAAGSFTGGMMIAPDAAGSFGGTGCAHDCTPNEMHTSPANMLFRLLNWCALLLATASPFQFDQCPWEKFKLRPLVGGRLPDYATEEKDHLGMTGCISEAGNGSEI